MIEAEKQEPVAAQCKFDTEKEWEWCSIEHHNLVQSEPHKWPQYQTRLLYTHPQPKREWVGLTDDEIVECWARRNMFHIAHAIEAKLKEKNT